MFATMQNALIAIKLKYSEFISAGILILILVLFYAFISVIYFKEQFVNSDIGVNNFINL